MLEFGHRKKDRGTERKSDRDTERRYDTLRLSFAPSLRLVVRRRRSIVAQLNRAEPGDRLFQPLGQRRRWLPANVLFRECNIGTPLLRIVSRQRLMDDF